MEDLYKELGFKLPPYVQNSYGIRIYTGTKGKNDWSVVIPKELVKKRYTFYNIENDYAVYLVSEQYALDIAKEYTKFAKNLKE